MIREMQWNRIVSVSLFVALLGLPVAAKAGPDDQTTHSTTAEALLAQARDAQAPATDRARAAHKALELGERRRDRSLQANALYALAQVEWTTESLADALEHCQKARILFQQTGDAKDAAAALRRTGDIQYRLGNYGRAMEIYLEALGEAEAIAHHRPDHNSRLAVGHIHVTLGNVLRRTGDKTQALEEYRAAASIYEAERYELGLAGIELNVGNLLFDMGRNREALAPYEKARDLARRLGNDELLSMALTNLASTEVRLGDTASARPAIEESIAICNRIGRSRGNLHNNMTVGDLLTAEGKLGEALVKYAVALELGKELDDLPHAAEIHGRMADVLHRLGKDRAAVDHLLAERKIRGQILDAEEAARISGLRAAHDAERHEAELILMQQKEASARRLNRYLRLGLALAVVLLAVAVGGLLARARAARTVSRQNAELESAYKKMEELSRTDELTGLPNRRDALLRLAEEARRSERSGTGFGVGIADVDGLKAVNDRLGHQGGDRLLMLVARALKEGIRGPDYVARTGGDEFLLLFPEVDRDGLRSAIERVLQAVRRVEVQDQAGAIRPTLSVGLAVCSGGDPEILLHRADTALYRAKSRGRDCFEILDES